MWQLVTNLAAYVKFWGGRGKNSPAAVIWQHPSSPEEDLDDFGGIRFKRLRKDYKIAGSLLLKRDQE